MGTDPFVVAAVCGRRDLPTTPSRASRATSARQCRSFQTPSARAFRLCAPGQGLCRPRAAGAPYRTSPAPITYLHPDRRHRSAAFSCRLIGTSNAITSRRQVSLQDTERRHRRASRPRLGAYQGGRWCQPTACGALPFEVSVLLPELSPGRGSFHWVAWEQAERHARKQPAYDCGLLYFFGSFWRYCWWRRRESNPRPQVLYLRYYMLSRAFNLIGHRPTGRAITDEPAF